MKKPPSFFVLLLVLPTLVCAQDDAYLPISNQELQIRQTTGFILGYSESHEQAAWVAYELTQEELQGDVERTNDFREDNKIKTSSASLTDYKYSGYDRGHLAPAADLKWSKQVMSESFLLSNLSPQHGDFNGGIWLSLERAVRKLVIKHGDIYVVTGPVFLEDSKTIGPNDVAIPSHYWKALYFISKNEMVGFMLPHEKGNQPLASYVVSVDTIENATGLDLFAKLPDLVEDTLEANIQVSHLLQLN